MAHIRAAEAPRFTLPGFTFDARTSPSRGASELCTWELTVAPGAASDSHSMDREEVFILLAGELTVTIDDASYILLPGDAISVPPGALLRVANTATTPARAVACIAAGFHATMANGEHIGTPPWAQ